MSHSSVSMKTTKFVEQRGKRDTGLQGRRLVLARVFWLVITTFELGLFVASLPGFVAQIQTPCTSSCASWQLSVATVNQLQQLGFPLGNYVVFNLAFILISALLSAAITVLLLWRRPNDWMALLVSLMLLSVGTGSITNGVLLSLWFGSALASSIVNISSQISVTIIILVFFLFPDGRFVPRWTRWVLILGIGASIFFLFFPSAAQSLIGGILYFSLLISLVIAQVYRFRRVSTSVERQQTKWVVYSLAVTIILAIGLTVLPVLIFHELEPNGSLFSSIANILANALLILLPISFGVAILRYRLWDVDVLINRTLVYGTLTVTLALVYFGLILSLQSLVRLFTGQLGQSPIVIVASTLTIAALFQPLRQRIQAIIDRRFYRRKYDSAKIMEAFSATLRNEVDLNQLREQLLNVVQETIQPTHVSLWVRPPEQANIRQATWSSIPPVTQDGEVQ